MPLLAAASPRAGSAAEVEKSRATQRVPGQESRAGLLALDSRLLTLDYSAALTLFALGFTRLAREVFPTRADGRHALFFAAIFVQTIWLRAAREYNFS